MLGLLLGTKKLSDNSGMTTRDYWPDRASRMTQAGTLVDEATSLTYSAVFCATRILTEGCSMVPLKLYQKAEKGVPREAIEMPQYALTASQPNPDMPIEPFKIGRTMHQVNGGGGFAEIERERFNDPESTPVALWPIDASRVRPVTSRDTDRRGRPLGKDDLYVVRNNDGTSHYMKSWEMLHIPGILSEDGIWAKSIVAQARQDTGAGLAMDTYAATFFSSAKAPPAVVYGAAMRDPEERRAFRKEWKEVHGSPFSGEIALLPIDAKYEKIGVNNNEGQFLESMAFNVHKIARFWRVPVHMMMEMMGPAGYNSILQLSEEFVRYSLMTWLLLWEGQCNQKLLTPEQRMSHFYAHDLHALLKADPETRAKMRETNIRIGHWSINDSRREDGMPEIGPAGDEHYVMTNMTTAERIYQGLPPPAAQKGSSGKTQVSAGTQPATVPTKAALPAPEKLIALPDLRQAESFDCGACATMCVADFFGAGKGKTEDDYIAELGTTEADGTQPEAIIDWLNDNGLVVTSGMGMTVDDLLAFFRKGMPVIVPMQLWGVTEEYDAQEMQNEAGHFCVVNGVGLGLVFFHDPVSGQSMLPEAEFVRRWHDTEADGVIDKQFGIAVSDEFMTEEVASEEEPVAVTKTKPKALPAPSKPAEPAAAAVQPDGLALAAAQGEAALRASALNAAAGVLKDGLSRLFTKESLAAERAARPGANFDEWVSTFYTKHLALIEKTLSVAFAVLETAGLYRNAHEEALKLCDASIHELQESYNTETPEKLKARLEKWPNERAEVFAKRIMGGADGGKDASV